MTDRSNEYQRNDQQQPEAVKVDITEFAYAFWRGCEWVMNKINNGETMPFSIQEAMDEITEAIEQWEAQQAEKE